MRSLLERLDRFQQSHTWLAFPLAVLRKFGDDRGGRQAALVAFYGFFALFPLLLVAVTILGFVLNDPQVQERIVRSALSNFPIIGDQIQENVGSLQGSGVALVSGLLGATWAGIGGVGAVQDAMNDVWDVPHRERLGRVKRSARALLMLTALGVLTLMATALSSFGGGPEATAARRLVAFLAAQMLNTLIFLIAFKLLTARAVSWRQVLPGALVAGAAWVGLQAFGGWFVQTRLRHASQTYGFFAIVIGLLSWMLISAQAMLIAAEVNVVRVERLWPRALFGGVPTEADRRIALPPL